MRLALDVYCGAASVHARLFAHSLWLVAGLTGLAALGCFVLRYRGAWLRYAIGSGCLLSLIATHSLILALSWQTPALALQVGTRHFSVAVRGPFDPAGRSSPALASGIADQGASAAGQVPNPSDSSLVYRRAGMHLRLGSDKNIDIRFLL